MDKIEEKNLIKKLNKNLILNDKKKQIIKKITKKHKKNKKQPNHASLDGLRHRAF
jgi:hypothetical protein